MVNVQHSTVYHAATNKTCLRGAAPHLTQQAPHSPCVQGSNQIRPSVPHGTHGASVTSLTARLPASVSLFRAATASSPHALARSCGTARHSRQGKARNKPKSTQARGGANGPSLLPPWLSTCPENEARLQCSCWAPLSSLGGTMLGADGIVPMTLPIFCPMTAHTHTQMRDALRGCGARNTANQPPTDRPQALG